MQGSQKSKRVSWASDGNLCQFRLFLSEESPSQVGVCGHDHLQPKKSTSRLPVNGLVADDNLPPGFENFNPTNQLNIRLTQIPVIKWRTPPKFILDVKWQVVSGNESKQTEIQVQRELRVLEAYYPRQSAIPPNPAVAPDAECAVQDDQTLPTVPLTPVDEEDLSGDHSSDCAASVSPSTSSNPLVGQRTVSFSEGVSNNLSSGTSDAGIPSSDQENAVRAALTAAAKNNEQIDHALLAKILSNPTILEQLVKQQGSVPGPQSVLQKPIEGSQPIPKPQSRNMKKGSSSSSSTMMSNGLMYPSANGTGPMNHQQLVPPLPEVITQLPPVSGQASYVRDRNYYKNLIQQHGGERLVDPQRQPPYSTHSIHHTGKDQDVVDNSKPRDPKRKIRKPCIYFNSSKGCRNGANCAYQHDMSVQQRDSRITEKKRMKLDRDASRSQPYSSLKP